MTQNPFKTFHWTEEHDAFCYQHHICPAAKILLQWLMRQTKIATEIEPHLVNEFNPWVAKNRGKGYNPKHLKYIFNQLVESRIIQVIKKFSWAEFRLIIRPLECLKPPRKRREKNPEFDNSTSTLDPSNDLSTEAGFIQQQHLDHDINKELLSEEGIDFNDNVTEVLDRPVNEIKLALVVFDLRGGFDKIPNPEGFIRQCLREKWWLETRNYYRILQMFGNTTEWEELFPVTPEYLRRDGRFVLESPDYDEPD